MCGREEQAWSRGCLAGSLCSISFPPPRASHLQAGRSGDAGSLLSICSNRSRSKGVQEYLGSLHLLAVGRIFGSLRNSQHWEQCLAHGQCLRICEKKEGIWLLWKPGHVVLIPGEAVAPGWRLRACHGTYAPGCGFLVLSRWNWNVAGAKGLLGCQVVLGLSCCPGGDSLPLACSGCHSLCHCLWTSSAPWKPYPLFNYPFIQFIHQISTVGPHRARHWARLGDAENQTDVAPFQPPPPPSYSCGDPVGPQRPAQLEMLGNTVNRPQ